MDAVDSHLPLGYRQLGASGEVLGKNHEETLRYALSRSVEIVTAYCKQRNISIPDSLLSVTGDLIKMISGGTGVLGAIALTPDFIAKEVNVGPVLVNKAFFDEHARSHEKGGWITDAILEYQLTKLFVHELIHVVQKKDIKRVFSIAEPKEFLQRMLLRALVTLNVVQPKKELRSATVRMGYHYRRMSPDGVDDRFAFIDEVAVDSLTDDLMLKEESGIIDRNFVPRREGDKLRHMQRQEIIKRYFRQDAGYEEEKEFLAVLVRGISKSVEAVRLEEVPSPSRDLFLRIRSLSASPRKEKPSERDEYIREAIIDGGLKGEYGCVALLNTAFKESGVNVMSLFARLPLFRDVKEAADRWPGGVKAYAAELSDAFAPASVNGNGSRRAAQVHLDLRIELLESLRGAQTE